MSASFDNTVIAEVVETHGSRPELLIQILHGISDRLGFIPDEAIRQLADTLNLSRADIHGVVSYYHDFRTEPPGRHVIKVCQAEACQAMGSRELTAHAERTLGVELNDGNSAVTLEPVYCLGNCACSPAVMIDGKTYGRVSDERFDALVGMLGDETR